MRGGYHANVAGYRAVILQGHKPGPGAVQFFTQGALWHEQPASQ